MKKILWGIIGPGHIANRFADGLKESSSGNLIAIASTNDERRKIFGDKYQIDSSMRFKNYNEIINCSEIDAIYISTPHNLHAEWTIKAAGRGKHVLCEKPGAVNLEEGKKIIKTVKEAGIFYMEGFMYRCHPQIKILLKLLKEKKIGDIKHVESSFGFDTEKSNPDSRLFNINLAGGSILDVGLYPISFARMIAGASNEKKFLNPIKLTGTAKIGTTGVDEVAFANLEFENGITAKASTAIRQLMDNNAIIKGTKGSIELNEPWTPGKEGGPFVSSIKIKIDNKTEIIDVKVNEHLFYFEAEQSSQCIQKNKFEIPYPGMTWDDTLGNLKTLDQWRKAIGYKLDIEK
tara:strand:+ start:1564 stop:2604 length:1041 start_codon:yes stop_codon:yes gene_type:complete